MAAQYGHSHIIAILLAHGADVHAQDEENKTPLHMVKNKESLMLLHAQGADITMQDMYGNTPLHEAARCTLAYRYVYDDLLEMVATLLELGTDPNAQNKNNRTPLHHALCVADSENWTEPQEKDLQVAIIKLLLASGAHVNIQDKEGWTPLHLISYLNHARMIPLLLAYGADLNIKTNKGQTALHLALEECNVTIVKQLLEAGAQVNAQDENMLTPLHVAVSTEILDSVALDNLKACALELESAMHLFVYEQKQNKLQTIHGLQGLVTLLLEHGADCTAQNNDGKTPHMIALERGHKEIVALLEEYENKPKNNG